MFYRVLKMSDRQTLNKRGQEAAVSSVIFVFFLFISPVYGLHFLSPVYGLQCFPMYTDFIFCILSMDFSFCLLSMDFSFCLLSMDFSFCVLSMDFSVILCTLTSVFCQCDIGLVRFSLTLKFANVFQICESDVRMYQLEYLNTK